jgi:hypothetical protein
MSMSDAEKSLRGQHGAFTRWSQPGATRHHSRTIIESQIAKFILEVDPLGELDPEEARTLAERKRKAYFADLARRSLATRRLKGGAADVA